MQSPNESTITISPLSIAEDCDITALFEHYASQPWAMLLDSANSQHEDGRYDIFVAQPIATIVTRGEVSEIWRQEQAITNSSKENPITLLQDLLDESIPQVHQSDNQQATLPFLAGALGYFAYDLGRRFEHLPDTKAEQYHSPDMAVGVYTWSVVKDKQEGRFYLCAIDLGSRQAEIAPTKKFIEELALRSPPSVSKIDAFYLQSDWQANMQQKEYEQRLEKIDAYLKAGDSYQVNLAQRFSAGYSGDEWQAFLILREANRAPFSAFLRLPQSAILSISPERFLSVKDQKVQSKPIKGTRQRSQDPKQDQANIDELLHSPKDQAENLMIVDLLRNDLSKNCQPGSVHVPKLFEIESFAAVHHLVSTVTGTLKKDTSPLALFQGAFPGGSITGAPKVRAMQIIDELEPHKRNIYCGSIAYIGINKDMDSSICIRTLLCEQGEIFCWAGGGIVIDSEPKAEYQESLDKVSKILPLLTRRTNNNEPEDATRSNNLERSL
jgi:para-aminobenzoate synthetase component 1